MKKQINVVAVGALALLVSGWVAGPAAQTTSTGLAVKPSAIVNKSGSAPPANATTTKAAGANRVKVSTANHPTDDDSFWIERVDVDGDGDVEDTNLVWDDEDKGLFAYSVTAFGCRNGGTATAELLIATFAAGNPGKRPAGSGFWVADLDKGECGAQAAALWGCRFDAKGDETACGAAVLDEKTDELTIVTASM